MQNTVAVPAHVVPKPNSYSLTLNYKIKLKTYMGIWQTIALLNVGSTSPHKHEALLSVVEDKHVL